MPVNRQKQLGVVDAHWKEWQKRHRAPRAVDLVRKDQESKSRTTLPSEAPKAMLGDVLRGSPSEAPRVSERIKPFEAEPSPMITKKRKSIDDF